MTTTYTLVRAARMAAVGLRTALRRAGAGLALAAATMTTAGVASAEARTLAWGPAEATVGADVVSRYVWRGQDLGHAAVQPTLSVAWGGLSLEAWGSVGLTDPSDTKEFDLTLAYTAGGLTVGLTDYWFDQGAEPKGRYFVYDAHSTNHVVEATVGYDLGPVAVAWYTNVAGADGRRPHGQRAYSSYAEVSAPFRWAGLDWTATVGAVPWATDFYDVSGLAVTHVALRAGRDLRLGGQWTLPLFAELGANPSSGHAFLTFGLTLQP